MLRSILMCGAALIMLGAAAAMSQPSEGLPGDPRGDLFINVKGPIKKVEGPIKKAEGPIKARRVQAQAQAQVRVVARPVEPRDYWLGIRCFPVTPALRSQLSLPKKQGLLVMAVIPKSPAMKAGLAPHDVLLRVGDKPLGEVRDLIAVIQETKDSKLKIALIRGGKRLAVEATLIKRPAEARRKPGPPPKQPEQLSEPADWKKVQKWLEGMRSDKEGQAERPSLQLRVFQPGVIVKDVLIPQRPLPANMSVAISKEGNQPAKIVVRRGDKKWELTEKELGKLPANVRPFVEQMLGRGVSGKMQVKPLPPGLDQRLERHFGEMNRRMDRLFKMMEEMVAGHRGQPPESDD